MKDLEFGGHRLPADRLAGRRLAAGPAGGGRLTAQRARQAAAPALRFGKFLALSSAAGQRPRGLLQKEAAAQPCPTRREKKWCFA